MTANPDLPADDRTALSDRLASLLADEHVLYVKTRNFHWNVTGPRFHDLHVFFASLYGGMEQSLDDIAERIRALGRFAPGSLRAYLERARLSEAESTGLDATAMLKALLADHEALILTLRADIRAADEVHGDAATADFVTGLLADHEKKAWMLRASVAGGA